MDERIMPEGFGGTLWANQNVIHPLAVLMVVTCGVAMLLVPRRYAVVPMLVLACFVAPAQRIVVAGLDFNMLRVMTLIGWMRLVARREYLGFARKPLDHAMVAYVPACVLTYTVLHGTSGAFVYKLGCSFDSIGMYFLFRCLVRDWLDLRAVVVAAVLLSIPVTIALLIEYQSGHNAFSIFGGVPEITMIREGRLRCQGAFAHPIVAGCFWACLLPLIAALWFQGGGFRLLSLTGVATSLLAVMLCASSTPVTGVAFGVIGGLAFCVRHYMRILCWGLLLTLCGLHVAMKAPVWHLICRFTITRGNTGYHRFLLIDNAIRRFDEWWLIGTRSTAHWAWGLQDVTNQYVLEGVEGGVFTLSLFVLGIALGFRGVGRTWRFYAPDRATMAMAWALGVSLFVHCTNFFGVSYFGQMFVVWYLVLAAIGSLTPLPQPVAGRVVRRSRPRPRATNHVGQGTRAVHGSPPASAYAPR